MCLAEACMAAAAAAAHVLGWGWHCAGLGPSVLAGLPVKNPPALPCPALTPSAWPALASGPYAGSRDYVSREELKEARHWYRYAEAAYGKGGWTWNVPK